MEEKHLLILIIAALNVVVLFVLWLILKKPKPKKIRKTIQEEKEYKNQKAIHGIEQLVDIAANRNSTKNDLTNAVMKVAKSFPFPEKIKGKVPKRGKVYLNFVLLVASHRNADAKLVAFMNTELKKNNKEYTQEIDIYENEGISQRNYRV